MASMSYCMFENTLNEMRQCVSTMEDAESLQDMDMSDHEMRAFHAMWRTARDFLAEHERLLRADLMLEIEARNA